MAQTALVHLSNWLRLRRETDRSINEVARSGFHLAINSAEICADYAKAQELDSSEEIQRENSRCPTRDSTIRIKGHPQHPARDYNRRHEHDETEHSDNLQRHNGKRSYPIQRQFHHLLDGILRCAGGPLFAVIFDDSRPKANQRQNSAQIEIYFAIFA